MSLFIAFGFGFMTATSLAAFYDFNRKHNFEQLLQERDQEYVHNVTCPTGTSRCNTGAH